MIKLNKIHKITFEVKLLEDCHSGSGLGMKGIIDDMQARDSSGKPVVWGTTLKGILRNIAEELLSLNHSLATKERIIKLFGSEGSKSEFVSNLVFSGLHFVEDFKNDNLKPVFSTSREIHSRKPLNDTFRCVEMLSAGLKAQCEAQLFGDNEDVKFLKLLLQRMVAVGGNRSRGKGRIITSVKDTKEIADYKPETKEWKRIRLLLRTVAPICLPKASVAGNIIDSESYISGSKIKGAMLSLASFAAPELKDTFSKETKEHLISFGNCYPVSELTKNNGLWKRVEILPVPLTMAAKKSTSVDESKVSLNEDNSQNNKVLPWWSKHQSKSDFVPKANGVVTDKCFYYNDNFRLPSDYNYKRIKEDIYLAINEESCSYYDKYQPKMISMLRNRTPVNRSERKKDLRRLEADEAYIRTDKGSLFSTICLSENEYLLCDIYYNGNNYCWPSIIEYIKNNHLWLRLGRGGQPIEIEDYELNYSSQKTNENQDMLILTMTSDFILRDDTLNFVTSPTKQNFFELFDEIDLNENDLKKIDLFSFTEPIRISGFNSSARVRLPERLAMKKGSVFVFKGDKSVLDSLLEKLKNKCLKNEGIGEYTDEGFGRFVVNCPLHTELNTNIQENENKITYEKDPEELIIEEAFDYFENNREKLINKKNKLTENKPTITQWHYFKEKIDCCNKSEKLKEDFEKLKEHFKQRAKKEGGRCWKYIVCNKEDFKEENDKSKKNDYLDIFNIYKYDQLKTLSYLARICCNYYKSNNN